MANDGFHQQIPRPATFFVGSPPSFAGNDAPLSLEVLRHRLSSPESFEHAGAITSAVLIPLSEHDGRPFVLLTRRASTMTSEPLTVSFPGGRVERGELPLDAALREAEEEIGLHRKEVEVLGVLGIHERRMDGQRVLAVVGSVPSDFEAEPNPTEVDEVLEVPLQALIERGAAWSEWWGPGDQAREVALFSHEAALGRDLVWGLTARLLWQLLEMLTADEP